MICCNLQLPVKCCVFKALRGVTVLSYEKRLNCNMQKHSKCITFLICLQFSIINILYLNTILKPKQVIWLEKLSFGVYILAIFPTGNMASR